MGLFHQSEVDDARLTEAGAGPDPIRLFARWYEAARTTDTPLPDAMALATATPDGRPSSRMMLLKEFGEDGFVFYTNYESRKGEELDANPRAALTFHWPILERQVRVEGSVERTTREEAAEYFATRPRESRIGAWASPQSQVITCRETLDARAVERADEFSEGDIPLPPFWGGYRVIPERIEFWQGRAGRLHDRLLYERTGEGGWARKRLAP
jgi:pyridoxamine 5'-phosphate oxidase